MQIPEYFGFLTGKHHNSNLQTNYQLGWKGQCVIGKVAWYWTCHSATHFSSSMSHPPVPRALLCSWGLVYAQQKVGVDSFNLYFNSNVMVNIPFTYFWCVTIFAAKLVCWLAGHPVQVSCRSCTCTPQEGSFASCLLAALLLRSWSTVTNNTSFNGPAAEGVKNTIMTSPWMCSGAALAGLAGKNTCLRSQFTSLLHRMHWGCFFTATFSLSAAGVLKLDVIQVILKKKKETKASLWLLLDVVAVLWPLDYAQQG